jgi:arginine decarboxylase
VTPEGDIRTAFFLAYDEDNCDYLNLDDKLVERLSAGEELVSASFIIPYPPGFPILVPGQVISPEILSFMLALDVSEIHGYRPDLGLRVFTKEALKKLTK